MGKREKERKWKNNGWYNYHMTNVRKKKWHVLVVLLEQLGEKSSIFFQYYISYDGKTHVELKLFFDACDVCILKMATYDISDWLIICLFFKLCCLFRCVYLFHSFSHFNVHTTQCAQLKFDGIHKSLSTMQKKSSVYRNFAEPQNSSCLWFHRCLCACFNDGIEEWLFQLYFHSNSNSIEMFSET